MTCMIEDFAVLRSSCKITSWQGNFGSGNAVFSIHIHTVCSPSLLKNNKGAPDSYCSTGFRL